MFFFLLISEAHWEKRIFAGFSETLSEKLSALKVSREMVLYILGTEFIFNYSCFCVLVCLFVCFHTGMHSDSLLVYLILAALIRFTSGETEVKFSGQTEFVVNETSTTVIRLVIERTGKPANVTAVVSVRNYASYLLSKY